MKHKYYYLLVILLIIGLYSNGQNNVLISEKTGYGQNINDSPNAALEIRSVSKGILVPRMSNLQISYIANPAQGLLVFSTDDDTFYFYSSVDEEWKDISFGTGTINVGTPVGPTTGGVALNEDDGNPDASAMLDIQSNDKGILIPRMTSTEIDDIINPANGLLVFDISIEKFKVFIESSGVWRAFQYGSNTLNRFCGLPFTDSRDDQAYQTAQIGTQCWMAENLNIGTRIDHVTGGHQLNNGIIEKYCYNDGEYDCIYGGIYQWREMMNYTTTEGARGICPEGWHIPTRAEFLSMVSFLENDGHDGYEGSVLRSTSGWKNNHNGTDDYGFTALPAGKRKVDIGYIELGSVTYFSSSTQNSLNTAGYVMIMAWHETIHHLIPAAKTCSHSVRCIKNQ